jgi:hypothetical protein
MFFYVFKIIKKLCFLKYIFSVNISQNKKISKSGKRKLKEIVSVKQQKKHINNIFIKRSKKINFFKIIYRSKFFEEEKNPNMFSRIFWTTRFDFENERNENTENIII